MTTPTIDAMRFRILAEAAAGLGGKKAFLVVRNGVPDIVEKLNTGETPLLECKTDLMQPNRLMLQDLQLKVNNRPVVQDPSTPFHEKYDALFWSESSVFKFVMAYYPRIIALPQLTEFFQRYNNKNVFAVAHLPKSIPEPLPAPEDDLPFEVLSPIPFQQGPTADAFQFMSVKEFLREAAR